jgi:hypothetical protein
MIRGIRTLTFAIVIGLFVAFPLAARTVAAHEHVTIGEYELTVGWRNEPAVTATLNGLDLGIQRHYPNGTTVWVLGVAGNLTAVLSIGPASIAKGLEPQFGRDGWYTFDVIPTRPGTYAVQLNGTLGSTAVNVQVTLDDVVPASDLEFPVADPTPADLQVLIQAVNAGLAFALIVAVLGVLAAAAGIVIVWVTSRNRRKTP